MSCTISTTAYPAMTAGHSCAFRAPRMQNSFAQAMCGLCAMTSASILLIQTGVIAPVSLFALLIIVGVILLLVVLVGLISLSGLTGFVLSLVGLFWGLPPHAKTGD